jgi:hypothetical protein
MQSAETLLVTNPHDRDVCFKVKTTAPRRYCVRPNAARIPPHQTVKVEVLAQAMDRYPADDNCKDKFLVQMAWLPNKDIGVCIGPEPTVNKPLCSHVRWWLRAADVIEHWKELSTLATQKPKDEKPYAEKKLKSILEIPGRPVAASARASPPVAEVTPAGAPREAYQSIIRSNSSSAATPQVEATPGASSSEVDRLRAQLAQAQAALKKGGGNSGAKTVELMYAVMAVLLAFIFGYFL